MRGGKCILHPASFKGEELDQRRTNVNEYGFHGNLNSLLTHSRFCDNKRNVSSRAEAIFFSFYSLILLRHLLPPVAGGSILQNASGISSNFRFSCNKQRATVSSGDEGAFLIAGVFHSRDTSGFKLLRVKKRTKSSVESCVKAAESNRDPCVHI